ncbi:hypothetical protein [Salarchaeum sp. JOR-1]|uniref:hypothetical protein n=1 Tax=Salarchaeum sp. JOR-1 TaxID=2599399 RepID=UPI0011989427|nr:hypothetical protein [Salarchaeum sp. JOR-1]QDX41121.1 hypothetical protein FQU85_09490 [Salarchaeum sp. JOR-1]
MTGSVSGFLRKESAKYVLFCLTSGGAVALAQYAGQGNTLRTPGRLALAVALILAGSLAVLLSERCLDRFLEARREDGDALYGFLVVGVATLTAVMLVFYVCV